MLLASSTASAARAHTKAEPEAATEAPADESSTADATEELPSNESGAAAKGPTVHLINPKPDPDRGVLKLAKYRGSTVAAAPNAVVVTTHYDEICSEPCGIAVDVSERPIFFLIRDGRSVSYGFRLNMTGDVTIALDRPLNQGLMIGGVMATGLLILPAGIPMIIFAKPKVSYAPGPPSETQVFKKLKKAKA